VKRAFISSALLLACLWVLLLPQSALASQLIVNCDNPKAKYHSINDALSVLDPHDTNTLLISGTCNESVTVDGFTRLTLAGNPTATLIGTAYVTLFITYSPNVTVQDMTIQGGQIALWCNESRCQFTNLVAQGASETGVHVLRASALFDNCTVADNAGYGLSVSVGDARIIGGTLDRNRYYGAWLQKNAMLVLSGNVSVSNNGSGSQVPGIYVQNNSTLQITSAAGTDTRSISGNSGGGISLQNSSVAVMGGVSITDNRGPGIEMAVSSVVELTGAVSISGNTGNAIRVGDLSIVRFRGDPANSVSGNVNCSGQFSATRGYPSLGGTPTTTCSPAN
jgi:hypothetical protein